MDPTAAQPSTLPVDGSIPARPTRLRARERAAALGISEAELVALEDVPGTRRLRADKSSVGELIVALPSLGEVMALTRNHAAVAERVGVYAGVEIGPHASLVIGETIDLRLFLGQWKTLFAAPVETPKGPRWSLQAFDAAGEAVHKVYLPVQPTPAAQAAWNDLIERFADPDPAPVQAQPRAAQRERSVDAAALLSGWAALTDTHQFFGLLRQIGAGHGQALALAAGRFTRRVSAEAAAPLLRAAAETETPIMVFVGNPGCIQIHTGPVRKIAPMGAWINVLDADFNLHLDQSRVEAAWVVQKPTADGVVSSLELIDAAGEPVVRFFGKRKPGQAEDPAWRTLLAGLPDAPAPALSAPLSPAAGAPDAAL